MIRRLIYQYAGYCGVDPGPLTLRKLTIMAEGKEQYEWNFWASYLAIFANCNRDPKKHRPFTPQDFHPFATAKRNAVEACDLNGHMRAWKEAAERQRLGLKR